MCTVLKIRAARRSAAAERSEEPHVLEVPVFVDVRRALILVDLLEGFLHEELVGLFLFLHVKLEDVVEAVRVEAVVVLEAAAANDVPDLDAVLLGVVDVASAEDDLGAVLAGAVDEGILVGHVGVVDAVRVDWVPAVDDHRDGEGLVAESLEVDDVG